MTAINVVLEPARVHVFADGGHFSGKMLRRVAVKTYPLLGCNAVLAWSGPSDQVWHVLDLIALCGHATLPELLAKLPPMVLALGWTRPFSAIVAGVFAGAAMGVTIEETGVVRTLGPWNTVRSLSSSVPFDPVDIPGSGLRMMEDQRAAHGVVAGFVQHVTVEPGGISAAILRRWPDLVAGGVGETHAVKIEDLSVETINFKPNAVQGVVTSATAAVVPNAGGFPIVMNFAVVGEYFGDASAASGNIAYSVTRNRDGKVMASGSRAYTGSSYRSDTFSGGIYDTSATTSETYTITASANPTSVPTTITHISILSKEITALYVKK